MLLIEPARDPVGYPRKCSAVPANVRSTRSCCRRAVPTGLAPKARTDIDSVVPEDLRARLGNAIGAGERATTRCSNAPAPLSRDPSPITPLRVRQLAPRPLRAASCGWQCLRLPGGMGHMSMDGDGAVRGDVGKVELAGITKRFGTMVAVDDLDLTVQPGEFLSLLGPFRVRQDHHAADAGRVRAARRRHDHDQRPPGAGHPALQARRQHRLPELRPVPAHGRRRERGLRACASAVCPSRRSPTASATRSTWSR